MKTNNGSITTVSVSFDKENNFHAITINGMKFLSIEKNHFYIPETLLYGINISTFPHSVKITPYQFILGNEIKYSGHYLEIINNGQGIANVEIEACLCTGDCTDEIGVEVFQAIKKELILRQKQLQPQILLYHFDDEFVHLHYSVTLQSDEIQNIIEKVNTIDNDLNIQIMKAVPDTLQLIRSALNLPAAIKKL